MRFTKRPRLTVRDVAVLVGLGSAATVLVAALIAADIQLSRLVQGGGAFYSPWAGARAILLDHSDPYSPIVARQAQVFAYGAPAQPGENPYRLNLPMFLLPAFFPVALIADPTVARGVWMFLEQAVLVAGLLSNMRVIEWRPRLFLLAPTMLLLLFGFYAVSALLEGTPVVLLVATEAGILLALRARSDEAAGMLLALSLFAWEATAAFLAVVVWHVLYERRWRVAAGFGMTLIVLLILAFLIYPGWLLPFVTATVGMLRSPHGVTMGALLTRWEPRYGAQLGTGLTVLVVTLLLFELMSARKADGRRIAWIASLALVVTPLVGFRTDLSNLVLLGPSFILICAGALSKRGIGAAIAIAIVIGGFVGPWVLVQGGLKHGDQTALDLLFIVYPCLSLVGMYWTRWWFIRPARTWLDEVRSRPT